MSNYNHIYEVLNGGRSAEFIADQIEDLTIDQRIAAANVLALAAIVDELSAIRHHGIAQSGQHAPEPEPVKSAYEDRGMIVLD